jgi:hypothetical protein
LEWRVTDPRNANQTTGAVLAKTANLSAEPGGRANACFTAPDGTAFVNLALFYQRHPGTVRVEGKLALKKVSLSAATADDCMAQKNPVPGA